MVGFSNRYFYEGPLHNVTGALLSMGFCSFILTAVATIRFVRLLRRDVNQRKAPLEMILVYVLGTLEVLHLLFVGRLYYQVQNEETVVLLNQVLRPPLSMQLAFFTTGLVVFVSQNYILFIHRGGELKWTYRGTLIGNFLSLAYIMFMIFFSPRITKNQRLNYYLRWAVSGSSMWVGTFIGVMMIVSAYLKKRLRGPMEVLRADLVRTEYFVIGSSSVALLMIEVPMFATTVSSATNGSLFWTLSYVAAYELVGNLWPYGLLTLLTRPGFREMHYAAKFPTITERPGLNARTSSQRTTRTLVSWSSGSNQHEDEVV